MELSGLSISISGSGRQAKSAVRGVRESLQDARDAALGLTPGMEAAGESMDEAASDAAGLSLALRGVRSTADEAGDEMLETAGKTATASAAISAAGGAAGSTNFSFMSLSTTTSLALIPSLVTLSTTLVPLVAAFTAAAAGAGALAGSFGALIGSGLLAWGEELAGQMQGVSSATEALSKIAGRLKQRLADVIAPLGESFVPLLEDASLMLPVVVEEMVRAVGGTEQFRDAMRDFGSVAARVLPAATGLMFDFAREALPVARDFFNFLLTDGKGAFDSIMASVRELAPEWNNLLDAVIEMSPVLLEFGTNVAEVVLPALTMLIETATDTMAIVNDLPGLLQDSAIAATILAPALVGVGSALSSVLSVLTGQGLVASIAGSGGLSAALVGLTGPVGIAIAAVGLLAAAWVTDFNKIRSHTKEVMSDVSDLLSAETPEQIDKAVAGFGGEDAYTEGVMARGGDLSDAMERRKQKKAEKEAGESAAGATSEGYLKELKALKGREFSESFLDPAQFRSDGEQAGQAAAAGVRAGLQQEIKSSGLTPEMREVLKTGVEGYKSKGLTDAPTKVTPELVKAMAAHPGMGASAENLGVSQREFELLKQRAGFGGSSGVSSARAAATSTDDSRGLPETRLSSLKPIVGKFESAVDKFARIMDDGVTVQVQADEEWVDAKIQRREQRQHREFNARQGGPRPRRR